MNPKQTFLFFVSLTSLALSQGLRYDNYTLYKILPENDEQIKVLQNVHNSDLRFDFWNEPAPSMDFGMILSSPQDKSDLENILRKHEIKYEIKMSNIQEAIDKETVHKSSRNSNNLTNMQWNIYYNLDQIYSWLDNLVATHRTVASIVIGGRSYEGRDIKGIRISHGSGRRAVFIEGGIHAREWISPSASCYVINELLLSNNSDIRAAAREFDWYIFPVTNPDGYVWSHTQNRLWRKNRRPINNNFGVDLNRNWNNNWLVAGSSTNPASDVFAGLGPFSEPETLSLSRYIRSMGDKIELYLSIHSFSQLLLIPFGNSTAPYGNYYDALEIGRYAVGALSVRYGTQYVVGNIAEAIYHATGGSIDWVKEHLQVPLAFCYELRDRGEYGFLLPVEQILPNNQEFMDSLIGLIYQAKRHGYMRNNANGVNASIFMMLAIVIGVKFSI